MKKNNIHTSEKTLMTANYIVLFIVGLIALYPTLFILVSSLSSGNAVARGSVFLWPVDFTFSAYKVILTDLTFWKSYGNTLFYMFFGTLFSMFISILAAYALSKKRLRLRRLFNFLLAFTIWFDPGIVPKYLNFKQLGLENNRVGIVIGFGVLAFNIIILRSYFESVPQSLDEAAYIDGASQFTILYKIYLPLSKAALATVTLFYAISRWNGYFWTMILIKDINKIPLQVYLRRIIVERDALMSDQGILTNAAHSPDTIIYATIIAALIPIIIIYPFIQKYFEKGIMLGGVKE
ncbi:carbohydrate ABC transporter permease [Clostridium sediminicola]|uniref:carbohydrate ABC transporter permease n=1 Tax=Clostridium sediminicola TaxID=3114879 RepID=UPI0031F1D8A8